MNKISQFPNACRPRLISNLALYVKPRTSVGSLAYTVLDLRPPTRAYRKTSRRIEVSNLELPKTCTDSRSSGNETCPAAMPGRCLKSLKPEEK